MKVLFVVMPFDSRYDGVYSAIRKACAKLGVECVRADEIRQPGPIINQIFDSIARADYVIAEISDGNPNVYYEVGVAHGVGKPTVLLAKRESISSLPFDVRHNRVVLYQESDPQSIIDDLIGSLAFLLSAGRGDEKALIIEAFLGSLSPASPEPGKDPGHVVNQLEEEFQLIDPRITDISPLKGSGLKVTVKDALGSTVVALLDVNGILRDRRRL